MMRPGGTGMAEAYRYRALVGCGHAEDGAERLPTVPGSAGRRAPAQA